MGRARVLLVKRRALALTTLRGTAPNIHLCMMKRLGSFQWRQRGQNPDVGEGALEVVCTTYPSLQPLPHPFQRGVAPDLGCLLWPKTISESPVGYIVLLRDRAAHDVCKRSSGELLVLRLM